MLDYHAGGCLSGSCMSKDTEILHGVNHSNAIQILTFEYKTDGIHRHIAKQTAYKYVNAYDTHY